MLIRLHNEPVYMFQGNVHVILMFFVCIFHTTDVGVHAATVIDIKKTRKIRKRIINLLSEKI